MPIPAQPGWFVVRMTARETADGKPFKSHSEDRVVAWSDDGDDVMIVGDQGPVWISAMTVGTEIESRSVVWGTEGQPVDIVPAPAGMVGYLEADDAMYPVAFLGWGDGTLYAYAVSYDAECGGGGNVGTGYGFFPVRVDVEALPKPKAKVVV